VRGFTLAHIDGLAQAASWPAEPYGLERTEALKSPSSEACHAMSQGMVAFPFHSGKLLWFESRRAWADQPR
jgi:hypothetical protein